MTARISLVAAACLGALCACLAWGGIAPIILASLTLAAALLALFNLTSFLRRPEPRYRDPDPARVRWPEALPLDRRTGHDRLLFCIHGFPSTPAEFRALAGAAEARGWDIVAPLLPGCGTDPRDLLDTGWSQYLSKVRDRWRSLRPRYRVACLVGSSMGGSLALALAEETCGAPALKPDALATVGSPAVLNAFFRYGLVKSPLIYIARTLGTFIPSIGARLPDPGRAGQDGDGDYRGYLGIYPKQTYTMQLGLRTMERRLDRVTCPVLLCHDSADRVIPFANQRIIAERLGSASVERYTTDMSAFTHARHNLLLYYSQRERAWKAILDFFERHASSAT